MRLGRHGCGWVAKRDPVGMAPCVPAGRGKIYQQGYPMRLEKPQRITKFVRRGRAGRVTSKGGAGETECATPRTAGAGGRKPHFADYAGLMAHRIPLYCPDYC